MDVYASIKGKCMWWREIPDEGDAVDRDIPAEKKRVQAVCFVLGDKWTYAKRELPSDCPEARRCRYYIKAT